MKEKPVSELLKSIQRVPDPQKAKSLVEYGMRSGLISIKPKLEEVIPVGQKINSAHKEPIVSLAPEVKTIPETLAAPTPIPPEILRPKGKIPKFNPARTFRCRHCGHLKSKPGKCDRCGKLASTPSCKG